jgi:hypothetical protein
VLVVTSAPVEEIPPLSDLQDLEFEPPPGPPTVDRTPEGEDGEEDGGEDGGDDAEAEAEDEASGDDDVQALQPATGASRRSVGARP